MIKGVVELNKWYREHEDPWYFSWRAVQQLRYERYIKMLNSVLTFSTSVLDIGCGKGYFTRHLMSTGKVTRFVGTDISIEAVDQAQRIFANMSGVSFQVEQLPNVGFYEAFDIVTALEVIYYVESKEKRTEAFCNIYNAIKPNGYALISVNIGENYFQESDFMDYIQSANFKVLNKEYIRDTLYLRTERKICHFYDVLKEIKNRAFYTYPCVALIQYFVGVLLRSKAVARCAFFCGRFSRAEPNILFVLLKK